jgi:hypothetical protein
MLSDGLKAEALIAELERRAEYWRTTKEDPHGIATAVMVALEEVASAVKAAERNKQKEA